MITALPVRDQVSSSRRALHELLLVGALLLAYKLGRLAITGREHDALNNADAMWNFERTLRLPSEMLVQHAAVAHEFVGRFVNSYYAYVHFPATGACLIWLFLRRPGYYLWARNILAWLTGAAFLVHLLFPLAPPRMLTAMGMVDTGALYGPSVYGSPEARTLSNQYAAMPSLHVGWAVVIAIVMIAATRTRWRWLWLAHPVLTAGVVVMTGNHYWLDILVVVDLLAFVLLLVPAPPGSTSAAGIRGRLPAAPPDARSSPSGSGQVPSPLATAEAGDPGGSP